MPNEEKPASKFSAVEQAKAYILLHQDESKIEQSIGSGLPERTIARARAELIYEKKLPAPRNKTGRPPKPKTKTVKFIHIEQAAPPVVESPSPADPLPPAPSPPSSGSLLDNEAMKALSALIDEASEEQDDTLVHKRLLKQCLMFAFDTRLHPDTRMSASTLWNKLKDQTRARELGPGKPKTREDATARMAELMFAVGAEITLAAVNRVFNVQEPANAGELPANTPEDAQSSASTPEAPGCPPPVSGDA